MKKILLFLLLVVSFNFYGQTPFANNDNFNETLSCSLPPNQDYYIFYNDSAPNGIDFNTIDLNPNESGIQDYYNESNGSIIRHFFNTNYVTVENYNQYPLIQFSYTFKDNLGNQSNFANVIINYGQPYVTTSNFINTTCDNPNSGKFTININNPETAPFTIKVFNEYNFLSTFTTSNHNFEVTGLPYGTYNYEVTYSDNCYLRSTSFPDVPSYLRVIYQENPLSGNAIATYEDFNQNGFVDVGDKMNCQYSVLNTSNTCILNTVRFNTEFSSHVTIPSIYPGETSTHNITRILNQKNINDGFLSINTKILSSSYNQYTTEKYITLNTPLNISNGIKLNAFIDSNSNGIKDGLEQNFTLGSFTTQLNAGMVHEITSNGIYYLYETNPTNSYNFTFAVNPLYASQYSVATASFNNISVANGSGITTLNFPVSVIPYNDSEVHLFGEAPRPGFTYYNVINYKNNGNATIPSGTVTFVNNNVVSVLNVFQSGSINNANGFTYNFTNLLPYETRQIIVTMQVPVIPTVSLGQQLTNSASITIPANDINVLNNNSSLTQTIVGSYDPNDKTESHGSKILKSSFTANDYLTYKIQFENTGTADAITVKVNDVLEEKLDENSIKMVASSHNYTLDRTGKNLEWKFAGINLPPSVPETQIGHGYLVFQIKPKPGFAVGDIITNIANIYFDFNPAIVTEPCTTEFVAVLSNENFAFNNLKIYPNPATNFLNVYNSEKIDKIEVSNVLGQTILSEKVDNLEAKIDLSSLTNGVYFVKVLSNNKYKTVKIIKD